MDIKEASLAEIPLIRDLAEAIWWPSYSRILSKAQIEFMLKDMYSEAALREQMVTGNTFLLVCRDDKPVAFTSYSMSENNLRIHKLYVLPSEQGKGTGKQLINHLAALALENQASELELNVNRNNPALGFYRNAGFEIIDTVDIPYHEFVLNDYVMRKSLSRQS